MTFLFTRGRHSAMFIVEMKLQLYINDNFRTIKIYVFCIPNLENISFYDRKKCCLFSYHTINVSNLQSQGHKHHIAVVIISNILPETGCA